MRFLLVAFLALSSALAAAPLRVARVFGPHMVLPSGVEVPVWGEAAPGAEVTVSFAGKSARARSDSEGKWAATLPAMAASAAGRCLVVSEKNGGPVELDDVLVGEVWLCSGQSNMDFRLAQATGGKAEAAKARDPLLRMFPLTGARTSPGPYSPDELARLTADDHFQGKWEACTPEAAAPFSAVAYWFGQEIAQARHVPVGLIENAVGGSGLEAWLPDEVLASRPEYASLRGDGWTKSPLIGAWARGRAEDNLGNWVKAGRPAPTPNHPCKPGFLFASGVRWLAPLPVRGVLWYQGETNAELDDREWHEKMLVDFVSGWRKAFRRPDLLFLMVQLPRINDATPLRAHWGNYRSAQAAVAARVPGVSMAVTIDLGSRDSNVHPPDKQPVAHRLARLARAKVYGEKVPCEGPRLASARGESGKIVLRFTDTGSLRTADGQAPRAFEVAGADGKFVPAIASLSGNVVLLGPPPGIFVKMVRYAGTPFCDPNLTDDTNLPAVPFEWKP